MKRIATILSMLILGGCATLPVNPSKMTAEQIKAAVSDKSYSMGCAHVETPYKIGTIFLNLDKAVLPNGQSGKIKINSDCSVEWTVDPKPLEPIGR